MPEGRSQADDYLEAFVPANPVEPAQSVFMVIDMQYASASRDRGLGRKLAEEGREALGTYRFDRIEKLVVPNIKRLIAGFRAAGSTIVYLTVGSQRADFSDMPPHMEGFARWVDNREGTAEHEILAELAPAPGDIVLNKTTVSGFTSPDLDRLLREQAVRNVVIAGVSTNSCVETTARDAADRGYFTTVIDDACGAARPEFHAATLASFRRLFGRVATTEQMLSELAAAGPTS